ncbi:MAG: flagellar type III secretion system pore protein FliP [Desulfatitalea sp.]|nr:flagellar type III secretion system pore protein FliP [Desulfatitalea sp.]NNK00935.1 flagellar type III secretion system pore protein FliP [Desulfatitalea sp.]
MRAVRRNAVAVVLLGALLALCLCVPAPAQAQDSGDSLFRLDLGREATPGKVSVVLQIFLLMTVLSLAPSILIMVTCFTRIAIVLSLLRQAIGSNQLPPNQIIVGLALFLTFFIMTPIWQKVNVEALQPYLNEQLTAGQALEKAAAPIRTFMTRQTREKDLTLMVEIAKLPRPKTIDDLPITVLIPAFIISELKTAFQIGFMLYIPFLIIDMVVASVLLSMGMMMLPPVMVSLPFKLMIFVLTDGWYLIVGSLAKSFVI